MAETPIDRAAFAELEQTAGAAFVTELAGTFLEEAPQMLAELRAAEAAAAADRFRRAAHSLKSNGQTFGATRLAALARALELGGLGSGGLDALDVLDVEYARVAAALEELRRG